MKIGEVGLREGPFSKNSHGTGPCIRVWVPRFSSHTNTIRRGPKTISIKGQTVNMSGYSGPRLFPSYSLCCCSRKASWAGLGI